jgi:hypothetical protein
MIKQAGRLAKRPSLRGAEKVEGKMKLHTTIIELHAKFEEEVFFPAIADLKEGQVQP